MGHVPHAPRARLEMVCTYSATGRVSTYEDSMSSTRISTVPPYLLYRGCTCKRPHETRLIYWAQANRRTGESWLVRFSHRSSPLLQRPAASRVHPTDGTCQRRTTANHRPKRQRCRASGTGVRPPCAAADGLGFRDGRARALGAWAWDLRRDTWAIHGH